MPHPYLLLTCDPDLDNKQPLHSRVVLSFTVNMQIRKVELLDKYRMSQTWTHY